MGRTYSTDQLQNGHTRNRLAWAILGLLGFLEGAVGFFWIADLPKDSGERLVFGYSAVRAGLMAGTILGALFFAFIVWSFWRKDTLWARWNHLISQPKFNGLVIMAAPPIMIACWIIPEIMMSFYQTAGVYTYLAYTQRLLPVFIWVILLLMQLMIGLSFWGGAVHWGEIKKYKKLILAGGITWLVFGLIYAFVLNTGIGIKADRIGWGMPTVPLMEWQIWLSWGIGGIFFMLFLTPKTGRWLMGIRVLDIWFGAVIWLTAVTVWLSQPVPPGYFATPGRAPNYEVYPFSDGALYGHYAQSVIAGEGFMGDEIPPRPLYIVFLAGLHAIAGQDYNRIIALQSLVLAFFPVCLYFIGKELNSRPAGMIIAMMAILRELTSILVTPFTDDISNSKLFFADMPTALVISLFILIAIKWLKEPEQGKLLPLLSGGVMGMAILVRTQSAFILPLVMGVSLVVFWKKWSRWVVNITILFLGIVLCVSPWLWRNWNLTGRLIFDDPKTQTGFMLSNYEPPADYPVQKTVGESDAQYSERVMGEITHIILTRPDYVAGFTGAHFLNNQIDNILTMPIRYDVLDWKELIFPSEPFWQKWNGNFSLKQNGLMLLNLGIIALGIGACWRKYRLVGLLPLFANLGYNFSSAIARNSGLRYLLPVDWVIYFYYGIGLVVIFSGGLLIAGYTGQKIDKLFSHSRSGLVGEKYQPKVWEGIIAGLCIFMIGSTLPLAERIVPERYPVQQKEQLVDKLMTYPSIRQSAINLEKLRTFALSGEAKIVEGRAIYPRYYYAGEGEARTAKQGYEPLDYSRLIFLMVSHSNGRLILRLDQPPGYFPNAADVMVLSCKDSYQAVLALVEGSRDFIYFDQGLMSQNCRQ